MPRRQNPLFLARASYRRRRLRDAARLVPLVAALFLLMPVLWTNGQAPRDMGADILYFFALWFALVLAAALLAPGLSRTPDPVDDPEDED